MGISIDNGDALFLFIYMYILMNAGLPGILGDSLFLMELWILLIDSSMKIPFNHCIRDGDFFIVYERHDTMKAVKVCENSVLQIRFGVFKHSDWIGKPFGSIIFSNRGGFVYVLASTPELWTLVLSHRTQILYIADISFVIMYLEVVQGCLVLESGTGSGSLTTSFARAVAPTGHVYTFDFH
ncbi:tRNA (adenine(58)-N(1))-methyltransferase catalytic subunit TRMT61A [Gossypium hirsutum]|uniref:tRNA (adenine(58)-N(1))-methyltransferase n=2 Tax=Gossypium TaxID=3633 RepID=A0ABM2YVS5_GOSHI|nr:tRNA (adenine(58)-N(1))-methyltransferase catalytic subunit TRMT61A-like [Gossypium hirsutum]